MKAEYDLFQMNPETCDKSHQKSSSAIIILPFDTFHVNF